MRTLHIPFTFLPDQPGGTEVYVEALCRGLERAGVEAIVAAPGVRSASYEISGLRVRRFSIGDGPPTLEDLYGPGSTKAAATFARILERERPDIVHQHALTPACSPLLAREASRRGLPVVFTYHTPTATCQRGTLLEWGSTQCDGRIDVGRCTACTLDGLGTGRTLGRLLAAMPRRGGDWIGRARLEGAAWTALRMSSLLERRKAAFAQLVEDVDRFVILTPWVEAVLAENGVPKEKMAYSAHGVPARHPRRPAALWREGRLRVAHLGRTDPVKGTELLIRAMRSAPQAPIELDIYGIVQDDGGAELARLQALAGGDMRIRFLPPLKPDDVPARLADYDVLAVPSQWMETGPLVVLEAFSVGVPVLGSALGGVADKVTDGVDGILVRPFNDIHAWTGALQRCAADPGLIVRLARGVRAPRPMTAVVDDMRALYNDVLGAGVPATRGDRPTADHRPIAIR